MKELRRVNSRKCLQKECKEKIEIPANGYTISHCKGTSEPLELTSDLDSTVTSSRFEIGVGKAWTECHTRTAKHKMHARKRVIAPNIVLFKPWDT